MRLTLRTLLAYLDDTLPANEIKEIGQKVSESDAAQELIARIKQVTRRRRLTTPPSTGPGAKVDPNTIAEYLDNLLSPEQVAEVESICLESDVHLAEIAACHQILTLVLGQKASVPPPARQRMYGLVRGREAVPSRRAKAIKPQENGVTAHTANEGDEALLMGMPLFGRQHPWMMWALPLVAVCLLAALGIAIWKAIPQANDNKPIQVADGGNKAKAADDGGPKDLASKDKADSAKDSAESAKKELDNTQKDAATTQKQPDGATTPKEPDKKGKEEPVVDVKKELQPSKEKKNVGRCVQQLGDTPSLLLHGIPGTRQWSVIGPDKPVSTDDVLVALPGTHADVRLDSGVRLTLYGNLEEYMDVRLPPNTEPCLESSVVLHANPQFDLDFTHSRGRVYLLNEKDGPATVRVRFHQEIWDLTLEDKGAEVGIDLSGRNTTRSPFQSGVDPRAELYLCVLKGKAATKIGYQSFALTGPPGPAFLLWDNEGRGVQGPIQLKENIPIWRRTIAGTKLAQELKAGVEVLCKELLNEKKSVEVTLQENLGSTEAIHRILAVLYLEAIDDIAGVIEALDDQNPGHFDVRRAAISALQHWIGRNGSQDEKLYNSIKKTGILIDKKFTQADAETIMQLLHGLSEEQLGSPETYDALISYLRHKKLPIRELASMYLYMLVPQGRTIPYSPVEGTDVRENAYEQWKKLIPTGKLPPPPPNQPPKAGGNGIPPK
jgi:hypothetical protein